MSCQDVAISFHFHWKHRGRVQFCIPLLHTVVQQHHYLARPFSFVVGSPFISRSFQAMLLFIISIGSGAGGFSFSFRCSISLCHNNYNLVHSILLLGLMVVQQLLYCSCKFHCMHVEVIKPIWLERQVIHFMLGNIAIHRFDRWQSGWIHLCISLLLIVVHQHYSFARFEASFHSLCCLMNGQQPCGMHVPYILWYAPGGRYKQQRKIGWYSISFDGARSLEVVGCCFVATLDVQQLHRLSWYSILAGGNWPFMCSAGGFYFGMVLV